MHTLSLNRRRFVGATAAGAALLGASDLLAQSKLEA